MDFSESSWSTEQKNGLKKKFHRRPSKDVEAEGGRMVKERDFRNLGCIFEKKMMMKSCLDVNRFQIKGLWRKLSCIYNS
jgi:hypothetical protein